MTHNDYILRSMHTNERAEVVKRAIRDVGEAATVAVNRLGATVGVFVPSSHAFYGEVMTILQGDTGDLDDIESVRLFLSEEYLMVGGVRQVGPTYHKDVIWQHHTLWCCRSRREPLGEPEFLKALAACGASVSSTGNICGLVVKSEGARFLGDQLP